MEINSLEQLNQARQEYNRICQEQDRKNYGKAEELLKAIQKAQRDNREWRR